jgi:DNA-binding NtrC family response regulator
MPEELTMDNFNVLLVDDEAEFLTPLVNRLKKRKFNILTAGTGEEALAVIDNAQIDVVVLDVRMPGMDGIQTLREIKKRNPLIEAIMLTGHASIEVAIQGMELGAFDYLMKPMNFDELFFKLQDAYEKKAIHQKKIDAIKK